MQEFKEAGISCPDLLKVYKRVEVEANTFFEMNRDEIKKVLDVLYEGEK